MTKDEVLAKVKATAEAPSCNAALKPVINEYLAAVGKPAEKDEAKKLIAKLKECVSSIDSTIAFMKTDDAKKYLGADNAAATLKACEEAKGKGEKYCICPACQNGAAVLANESVLLA